jgi:integrase
MAHLTDAKIRALKAKDKSYKVSDFDSLYLLVKPNASKLWRMKYRFNKREKTLSFGKYPEISLKAARTQRDEARSILASGQDPSEARKAEALDQQAANSATFEKLAQAVYDKKVMEQKAQATLKKTEWLHRLLGERLGRMPIASIKSRDVLEALKPQEHRGNFETAKRMRSAASAVFRYAIALELIEHDPTYALQGALINAKVKHRSAITDKTLVGGLMRAIRGHEGQAETRIALNLTALTALRPGEVRQACWEEIDFTTKIWTVPAERAKTRTAHSVPMSRQTIETLEYLRCLTGGYENLFYSPRAKSRLMSENTMNAALRTMGYDGGVWRRGMTATP